jgi:phosphatidylethanolamine/phosphatidyl-N-methylethanolamine N-methyltransferase
MSDARPPSRDRNDPTLERDGPSPTLTFFRQWLKNPLATAALSPSSRQLARLMIQELPPQSQRVIELGGGTGVFTRALLDHGIRPDQLMVLELNQELHVYLSQRFANARVVCGDARELRSLVRKYHFAEPSSVDAVMSGLGLLSMSRRTQREILEAAFSVLSPHGRFVQFTYGPVSPVARELLDDLGLSVRRGGFAWWNIPPASVYVFERSRSTPVHPVRAPHKR